MNRRLVLLDRLTLQMNQLQLKWARLLKRKARVSRVERYK